MSNYGMKPNIMQSSYNAGLIRSGVVTGLNTGDTIPNGALVFADNSSALKTTVYGTADLSLENFKKYASGSTNGAAYILDAAEVPEVTDANGNTYKVGGILSNLEFNKDKVLRYRKLQPEDRIFLFDGMVTGTAPTVGKFLIPTDASFNWTTNNTAAASGICLVVLAVLPLTAGLQNLGSQYLCKVVSI